MAKGDKKGYRAATFRLPPEVLEKLESASRETGVPKGAIVERALRNWLFGSDRNEGVGKAGAGFRS